MEIVSQSELLVCIFSGMGLCALVIFVYMGYLLYQRRRSRQIGEEQTRLFTHPAPWRSHVRDVFPDYEA
jgi:hypothetical protein